MSTPSLPALPAGPRPERDLRDALEAAFRRRRGLAAVAIGAFLLVLAVTLARGRAYEAQASVLVKFGREYVNRPEVGEQRALVNLTPEEVLNSEAEILASEDLVREVVTELGPRTLYPSRLWGAGDVPEAARKFRKALSIEPVRRSSVLKIAFRHPDPQLAARALHLLVARYEQRHLQAFSEAPLEFLTRQLRAYEEKLHGSERRLDEFRQSHGVFSYDDQLRLLLERRAELEAQHRQAGVELREIERRAVARREALGTPQPQEVMTDVQKGLIDAEGEARSRRARIASVSRLLDEIDGEIRDLDLTERQLAGLQREVEEDDKNYRSYREKVDEMTLSAAMNRQNLSNVAVLDAGAVPTRPARPRPGPTLAVALAFSIASAALYLLGAERFGQGLSTPERVERRLQVHVLASVQRHLPARST